MIKIKNNSNQLYVKNYEKNLYNCYFKNLYSRQYL